LFISEGDEKKSSNQTVKSAKLKNTDMWNKVKRFFIT
jgi:hypothetical protein